MLTRKYPFGSLHFHIGNAQGGPLVIKVNFVKKGPLISGVLN